MGNNITQCLFPRYGERNANSQSIFLSRQPNLLAYDNPISTAIHMISAPSEEESIGMAIILSNNVAAVANSDQTENGLKFLLEYLQLSLPMDCPLSGSITTLIIKEATLPSRSFLREVSGILKLCRLTEQLTEFMDNSIQWGSILSADNEKADGADAPGKGCRQKKSLLSRKKCNSGIANCSGRHNEGGSISKNSSMKDKVVATNQMLLKVHNACLIIDCLATRLCGPNTAYLLNDDIIRFLVTCCKISKVDVEGKVTSQLWIIVLRSILCFEKFTITKTCKDAICAYLEKENLEVPFAHLEFISDSSVMLKREVGFCSQWLLDNSYTIPGRVLSYERVDRTDLNAIMNIRDASQYIKLSPNGLEVRCDSESFESVRCTFEVKSGVYYYEAQLVTAGIMQIGWATKRSQYMNHDGRGVGDDMFSLAYDGCRRVIWYNGVPHKERQLAKWRPGDVLGCLINLNKRFCVFSLNGQSTKKQTMIFGHTSSGFYAGASFLNNQHCLFNFGREPFKYSPSGGALNATENVGSVVSGTTGCRSFNLDGYLDEADRIVYPRVMQLAKLSQADVWVENPCSICYSNTVDVSLEPCSHSGFCKSCISKVELCPLCRSPITSTRSFLVPQITAVGEKPDF